MAQIAPLWESTQSRSAQRKRHADQVVNDVAKAWAGPHFLVSTEVHHGEPITTVCEVGGHHNLIVVGSHGLEGVVRFLFGSLSHGIVEPAIPCSW